jgi:hypothetical protein
MRHCERTNTPTFCRHFGKYVFPGGSRPTVEWNETDYDVVGEGPPLGRISTMSGANFSLD